VQAATGHTGPEAPELSSPLEQALMLRAYGIFGCGVLVIRVVMLIMLAMIGTVVFFVVHQ
jgi:hypothetical protein